MRFWMFLVCASLAPIALPAEDGPDDKLVQGELLEVSSGDLERAMAIYKAVEADEKAPEPTRARALLCLARCQRKLGELEAAKKTLDALIKAHATERDVIRQAQSFLKELEDGRATNPDFDWLKELEKSPEIQARVFDLTMDLMSPDTAKVEAARRQLRALGTIAVPVMERVLEVSRDALQRGWLASVLVSCGRHERIAVLLDPAQPPAWNPKSPELELLYQLEALSEQQRRDLIAAIDKVSRSPAGQKDRSLFLLAAGDTRDVQGLLREIETIPRWQTEPWTSANRAVNGVIRSLLGSRSKQDAALAEAMAQRVLDPACPLDVQNEYVVILSQRAPARLSDDHWVTFLERCNATPARMEKGKPEISELIGTLDKENRFDALRRLAAGSLADLIGAFAIHMRPGGVRNLPDAWGKVLRFTKPHWSLQSFAETHDAGVPDFVDFLRNRAKEDPDYVSISHWPDPNDPEWRPSPVYFGAMFGLLDDQDPVTVAIAVEALSFAPGRNPPDAAARIEKLARESGDGHVRELALYSLLRCFEKDPALGPAAAAALFREFQARMDVKETPTDYVNSPLARIMSIGNVPLNESNVSASRVIRGAGPPGISRQATAPSLVAPPYSETLGWVLRAVGAELSTALYPHVLAISDSASGAGFHGWFTSRCHTGWPAALVDGLDRIQGPELTQSALDIIRQKIPRDPEKAKKEIPGYSGDAPAKILAFLKRAALDARLPLEVRAGTWFWAREKCHEWFEWAPLFKNGDPIAVEFLRQNIKGRSGEVSERFGSSFWPWVKSLAEAEKQAIYSAALSSPEAEIRAQGVAYYPGDSAELPRVLRAALGDRDEVVREAALTYLKYTTRADCGSLYLVLIDDKNFKTRIDAIDGLPKFASVECIEPLTKMLDDPDVEVRDHALTTLKKVKSALEEKKEWQELVKKLKESKG